MASEDPEDLAQAPTLAHGPSPLDAPTVAHDAGTSSRRPAAVGARDDAHYTEGDVIGRGGMGEVISVFDRDLRRHVVMKKLHPDAGRGGESHGRFVSEARVTGQLSHPNIVPVYDCGITGRGEPFFTMKHVEGIDLGELVRDLAAGDEATHRRYPVARRLELFGAVCNALAFAHSRAVIHRDLKPANIMVGAFGEVLVMDWGLAKSLADPAEPDVSASADIDIDETSDPLRTRDGAILGTPAYMPPEQAAGDIEAVDTRSDIYSLGAVLFELLVFRPPYEGATVWDVLARVTDGRRIPPGARPGDPPVPRELVAIVDKAMARDPEARYQTVEALHEDLLAYRDHRAIGAASYTRLQRLGKWVRRNRAAVVAATLLIGGVGVTYGTQQLDEFARRRAARAALRQAHDAGGGTWYERRAAVLAAARALVAEAPDDDLARAELAEAARALARRLGADGNREMANLLLEEARTAGLPDKVYQLERWLIASAHERAGQRAALETRTFLEQIRAGTLAPEVGLQQILRLGRYPACTRVLVRGLFEGHAIQATVCADALADVGDTTTTTRIAGRVCYVTRPGDHGTTIRAQDEPRIRPLAKPLRQLTDLFGRPDHARDAVRQLTPPEALGLLLHTRVLQARLANARQEVALVWAALRAIGRLQDPAAVPLVATWQWRQGPDGLGWTLAARVRSRLPDAPRSGASPTLPGFAPALQRALVALSASDPSAAGPALDALRAAAPDDALTAYLGVFFALRAEGRTDTAALRRHEGSARGVWRDAIRRMLARAHPSTAEALLRQAADNDDPYALQALALRAETRAPEAALELASKAIAIDSRAQAARLLVVRHHAASRRYDRLLEHARQAIEMDPGSVHARLMLAAELRRGGQLGEALRLCDEALQRRPDHGPTYLLRGQIQLDMRESWGAGSTLALGDLRRAVAAMPGDARTSLELVRGLTYAHRYEEADAHALRLERTPLGRSARALRAWVLWHGGQHREAYRAANSAIEAARGNEPHLALAYLARGSLHRAMRQWDRMRADLKRARALARELLAARVDLEIARGEAQAGQLGPAIAAARRGLAAAGPRWLHHNTASAHLQRWLFWRGEAHHRAGRIPQAIADYAAVIKEGKGGKHFRDQASARLAELKTR